MNEYYMDIDEFDDDIDEFDELDEDKDDLDLFDEEDWVVLKVSCMKRSHNPFKRKVTPSDALQCSPKLLQKPRSTVSHSRCH